MADETIDGIIAKRIKSLREEKGVSQEELGNAIGLSRISIGNYEQNKRIPDLPTIIKMAEYFNCDMDYIFGKSAFKDNEEQFEFLESLDSISEKLKFFDEESVGAFIYGLNLLLDKFLQMEQLAGKENVKIHPLEFLGEIFFNYQTFLASINESLESMSKEKGGMSGFDMGLGTGKSIMIMDERDSIKECIDNQTRQILNILFEYSKPR